MGRTGRMFAAEHFNAEPDIVTLAKGIASGMPFSATIARAEIMDWKPGAHASTFGGNPVSRRRLVGHHRTAGAELIENAARIGAHIMERMREWPDRFPMSGDVRGLGLDDRLRTGLRSADQRACARNCATESVTMAFERGLLILGCGQNSIRLCPPLVITKDQADWAIDTLEECLNSSGAGQVLDVGCGINKYPGAIGIDRIAGTRADVLCDLDRFPYPFADASFDQVRAVHVIEHVSDVIRTMEEFHRLLRRAGKSTSPRRTTRISVLFAIPRTAGI